eukprot:3294792-Karenia_brevis.AAC.1
MSKNQKKKANLQWDNFVLERKAERECVRKGEFIPSNKFDQYNNLIKDRKAELNAPAAPVMPLCDERPRRSEGRPSQQS